MLTYPSRMRIRSASAFQASLQGYVGKRLASVRGRHFTQSALAQEVGLTRASVSALEAGQQGPSLSTLCELALVLQVEPATLLPSLEDIRVLKHSAVLERLGEKRSAAEIVDEFLKGVVR